MQLIVKDLGEQALSEEVQGFATRLGSTKTTYKAREWHYIMTDEEVVNLLVCVLKARCPEIPTNIMLNAFMVAAHQENPVIQAIMNRITKSEPFVGLSIREKARLDK